MCTGTTRQSREGEYFRNNCWWWHPLADYVRQVASDIADNCRYWDTNDSDGLGAADALELAARLQAEIDSGRCEHYARAFAAKQEMTPNERCEICEGTGRRKPTYEAGAGDLVTGVKCNGCGGEGWIRPFSTWGRFNVQNVQNFVVFLRGCGGFAIW
jgi:hypothetical protein